MSATILVKRRCCTSRLSAPLPKGTDLSRVSQQQPTAIELSLNNRPRKILNFRSPAEVFS